MKLNKNEIKLIKDLINCWYVNDAFTATTSEKEEIVKLQNKLEKMEMENAKS